MTGLAKIEIFFRGKVNGIYKGENTPIPGVKFEKRGHLVQGNYEEHEIWGGVGWTPDVCKWRGHILSLKTGELIANPFAKFWNLGEHTESLTKFQEKFDDPNLIATTWEKMDGTMIVFYYDSFIGQWLCATRGSLYPVEGDRYIPFHDTAMRLMRTKYNMGSFHSGYNYICELIHPDNRIVTDYGNREELVLIGVRDLRTGLEFGYTMLTDVAHVLGMPCPSIYTFGDLESLTNHAQTAKDMSVSEGFVLTFETEDGYVESRVKVKTEQYRAIKHIIEDSKPKRLLSLFEGDTDFWEFIRNCPEEFRTPIGTITIGVLRDWADALEFYLNLIKFENRKDFARQVQCVVPTRLQKYIYGLRDGKTPNQLIKLRDIEKRNTRH